MKEQLTYKQAMQLIKEFSDKGQKAESIYFVVGFLESFTARLLSTGDIEHSIRVLHATIEEFNQAEPPALPKGLAATSTPGGSDLMNEICGNLKQPTEIEIHKIDDTDGYLCDRCRGNCQHE